MFGQDGDTYFGVQLPEATSTIAEAFQSLIPKEARNATQRQGEWFAVPVDESDIPQSLDCVGFAKLNTVVFTLTMETPDSNPHEIIGGKIRIGKDGSIYMGCGASLHHVEHATIKTDENQWYRLVRNTAVRSVSVEGVD